MVCGILANGISISLEVDVHILSKNILIVLQLWYVQLDSQFYLVWCGYPFT